MSRFDARRRSGIAIRALTFLLASAVACPAIASAGGGGGDLTINPIETFSTQMATARRECAQRGWDPPCVRQLKRLADDLGRLKVICREQPADERCGSIMAEKKLVGWLQSLCEQQPHDFRCVMRREVKRRKQKMMMTYCNQDPDGVRCKSLSPPPKRRPLNFYEQCKSTPEKPMCVAYMEKLRPKAKEETPDTNRF